MSTTNRELTKREIAQREPIFLIDLAATDVAVAKPPEPRHTSKATDQALDDFAPENFAPENFAPENFAPENIAPENFAPENFAPEDFAPEDFAPEDFAPEVFVRPSHLSVPLKPKSRAHPVALTCLGIVTAVFAFLVVERSTEPVSPPIPPKEPSAISEVDKSTLPPVSADNPPPVVDVPVTPSTPAPVPESTPAPVPEIAKAPPPKPVLPVAPRNDAPRARPPAPSVRSQPPSTARLDPPLSQRPPVVAGVPEPPSRPAADPPVVPPARRERGETDYGARAGPSACAYPDSYSYSYPFTSTGRAAHGRSTSARVSAFCGTGCRGCFCSRACSRFSVGDRIQYQKHREDAGSLPGSVQRAGRGRGARGVAHRGPADPEPGVRAARTAGRVFRWVQDSTSSRRARKRPVTAPRATCHVSATGRRASIAGRGGSAWSKSARNG